MMDYELYEELRHYIETSIEEKKNPKEAVKTLSNLIELIVDYHMETK